jgi:hypothetical protein
MKPHFWWRFGNKTRRIFGFRSRPKKCCRNTVNLGPVIEDDRGLVYRRCFVCNCRHFELRADPGKFGITLALRSNA